MSLNALSYLLFVFLKHFLSSLCSLAIHVRQLVAGDFVPAIDSSTHVSVDSMFLL